jgi:sortase A
VYKTIKKISHLLIAGGMLLLLFVGWDAVEGYHKQNEALQTAKQMVSDSDQGTDHHSDGDGSRQADQSAITAYSPTPTNRETSRIFFTPKPNDIIGMILIPKMNLELPIIEGTEEEQLKKGVGHFLSTVYPGDGDQILFSGHRDTVFTGLGELEKGDQIIVKMPYGEYSYSLQETEIVEADDTTVIRSTAPEEILTLSTCYPFNFVGNAPQRYIVYAKLDKRPS